MMGMPFAAAPAPIMSEIVGRPQTPRPFKITPSKVPGMLVDLRRITLQMVKADAARNTPK
jgi:hypothetical protein